MADPKKQTNKPSVTVSAAESMPAIPEQLDIKEMNVMQLEKELEKKTAKRKDVAARLLRMISFGSPLLKYYQAQERAPKQAAKTAQKGAGKKPARKSAAPKISATARKKAVEHKKRLLARIKELNAKEGWDLSPENLKEAEARIDKEASRLVKSGPSWSPRSKLILGTAVVGLGAVFLHRFLKSNRRGKGKSIFGAAWSTLKTGVKIGLGYAGLGFATRAVMKFMPGTTAAKYAGKLWRNVFAHTPFYSQHEQKKDLKKSVDAEDTRIDQRVSMQNLKELIDAYQKGGHTKLKKVGKTVDLVGKKRLKQRIAFVLKGLKVRAKSNPELKKFLDKLDKTGISKNLNDETIAKAHSILREASLREIFGDKYDNISSIVEEESLLLKVIDASSVNGKRKKKGDIPRSEKIGEKDPFRDKVTKRVDKTVDKIRAVKEKQTSLFESLKKTAFYMAGRSKDLESQERSIRTLINTHQNLSATNKKELEKKLASMQFMLRRGKEFQKNYMKTVEKHQGADVFVALEKDIVDSKEDLFAKADKVPNKREQLTKLYDKILGFEIIAEASKKVPKPLTTKPELMDLSLTTAVGALIGTTLLTSTLKATGKVGFSALKKAGSLLMGSKSQVPKKQIEMLRLGELGKFRRLVGVAGTILAYNAFKIAYNQAEMIAKVEGASMKSKALRGTAVGINLLAGGFHASIAYRTLRVIKDAPYMKRQLAGNVMAAVVVELLRSAGTNYLDKLATLDDFKKIALKNIPVNKLASMLTLYSAENGSAYPDLAKIINLESFFGIGGEDARLAMRKKILTTIGSKRGLNRPGIAHLKKYYSTYTSSGDQFEYDHSDEEDRDSLNNAMRYAALMQMGHPSVLKIDIDTASKEDVVTVLDDIYTNMERDAARQRIEKFSQGQAAIDPEARFLLDSFRGNLEEIFSFYVLVELAAEKEKDPAKKEKLEQLYSHTAIYLHHAFGGKDWKDEMKGKGSEIQQKFGKNLNYKTVMDFLKRQKSPDANGTKFSDYYTNDYILKNIGKKSKDYAPDKAELTAYLKEKGLSNIPEYVEKAISYTYHKGEKGGLIYREGGKTKEVFLGGEWRKASEKPGAEPSDWEKVSGSSYTLLERVHEGVRYQFVQKLGWFFANKDLPDELDDFTGSFSDGKFKEADPNWENQALHIIDIPADVIKGLREQL